MKEVGGHRVYLVGREGTGVVERLRPADVAPERGGILPKAPNRQDGLGRGQRAVAADEADMPRVLALLAVARGASFHIGWPSAAVPLPGGKPWPSGGMVNPRPGPPRRWAGDQRRRVGNWATAGQAPAPTRSAPIPASRHSLCVDIVDAPVSRHLPALDGVVEVDQFRPRTLTSSASVGCA